MLNWKIDEDAFWHYIGTEWEPVKDATGNPQLIDDYFYWKYKGKVNFTYNKDAGIGQWFTGSLKEIIFPTDYVCEKANFEFQEFCVVKNGFTHEYENPGLGSDFKPDYVLDSSKYNDRTLGLYTAQEKKDILENIGRKIEENKAAGYHPNEDPDFVINSRQDVEFRKYAWVGFPVDVDWKAGHKYTYVLDFTSGLGIETPNMIYGGRLISDIIKIFAERESAETNANSEAGRTGNQASRVNSAKSSKSGSKKKSAALPRGEGKVSLESSGEWTGGIIVK